MWEMKENKTIFDDAVQILERTKKTINDIGLKDKHILALRESDSKADDVDKILEKLIEKYRIQELETLFTHLKQFNVPKKFLFFDPWLARGLDYYTGPIFETVVTRPKIGSLVGGGRFDGLIGAFRGEVIPAVGISLGLDRLMIALKELNLLPTAETVTKVLIAQFDEDHTCHAIETANKLRGSSVSAEIYPDCVKLAKQFKYADRQKIPFVIVVGPDEVKADQVTIKNMRNGRQQTKKMSELIDWAKTLK